MSAFATGPGWNMLTIPRLETPYPLYKTYNYILDSVCFDKTTELWRYFREGQITPQFGQVNGTVTACSLKSCMKRYRRVRTRGNKVFVEVDHSKLDFCNAIDQPDIQRQDPDAPLEEEWYLPHITGDVVHYCASDSTECPHRWRSSRLHRLGARI